MENQKLTEYQRRTLEVLAGATQRNPITGREIANNIRLKYRECGKDGADMRSIIHALRQKNYPICAQGTGYFWARSEQELSKYITELQKRIDSQFEALNGLKGSFHKVAEQPEAPKLKIEVLVPEGFPELRITRPYPDA